MRTFATLVALAALLLVAVPATASIPVPAPYCQINHDTFQDQFVTYSGYTDLTVGVVFLDGSPSCQVWVVCWGELVECRLMPLP